jgi:N-acetylglucosamine repressor
LVNGLAKELLSWYQVFNPEVIIVGGKLAEAGQFLKAPINQALFTYSNPDISNDTEVVFSVMGVKAGTIGAAAFAIDKLAQ